MKQLTCEMCGGKDLIKEDGAYVCQSCGTKYSVEEAKKMMIEGTVEVQGSVQVSNAGEMYDSVSDKIKNDKTRSRIIGFSIAGIVCILLVSALSLFLQNILLFVLDAALLLAYIFNIIKPKLVNPIISAVELILAIAYLITYVTGGTGDTSCIVILTILLPLVLTIVNLLILVFSFKNHEKKK